MSYYIEFKAKGAKRVGLNFVKESKGRGSIDFFYAGKYVKTLQIDLTSDMEV